MQAQVLPKLRIASALVLVITFFSLRAQQPDKPPASQPQQTRLASGVERLAGSEPSSGIKYARLILQGSLHAAGKDIADPPAPDPLPVLIAQCTLRPSGRYFFEVFTSFGGATDLAFYPPWKSGISEELFPPRTDKVTITMEFLGYRQVKPYRRQWEIPVQTPALYRYNSPGSNSPNLEEFPFFLRYLLALPTLRLTLDNRTAEFLTTQFLADIRSEPLCKAAKF